MERTYQADRFDDALSQVRRELGPDAVIVSSRQLSKSLLGGRRVELKAMTKTRAIQLGLIDGSDPAERPGFFERRLTRMDVPTSAARTFAQGVHRIFGGEPPTLSAGLGPLTRVLREEMIFAGPGSDAARVVAMIGPTGVGKTTTIAKLAAIAALVEHRRVALVSVDQYRIGGAEQLERYADLIGIPMETAHDAPSLEISLRRFAHAELVLVDTAGRSPKDPNAIAALAETLHGVDEAVSVHLCLPAGLRDCELNQVIDRLAVVRPNRLIATKLDEAVYHGSIVAAQIHSGLPLAWFTTGQRVPEDLEVASPERLADLLCGEDL